MNNPNLESQKKNKVVILGAGLAGLSAGWVLKQKGYEVTIIERDSIAGGLAITRSKDGFRWDLGPHNIHTNHQHILQFLKNTFISMYEHFIPSLIYKRGKFIQYPLKGIRVISTLPALRLISASISFFCARLRMFLGEPERDGNFEEWIKNRFGSVLYKEYFHDYPKKVWGIPPKEIDRYVADKRIPIMSITELIRTTIFGKPLRINHPEWTKHNFYLPNGIGALPEFFEKEFLKLGGKILFDSTPIEVKTDKNSVRSVSVKTSSESSELACDYLLSTIPLNSFVKLFQSSTSEARSSADKLDYVASVLLFLKTNIFKVLPAPLLYYSQPDVLFSRVSDVGTFSKAMVQEGTNLICLEFPCTEGDSIWNAPLDKLTSHAISVFENSGILSRDKVTESFLEKVSHSYPRFRDGFIGNLNNCHNFVHQFKNCLSYGRQGGFTYINTDGAINQGFHAAEAVTMAETINFSVSEWYRIGVKNVG